jgi:uncharacterized protein (TIGR03437 family)
VKLFIILVNWSKTTVDNRMRTAVLARFVSLIGIVISLTGSMCRAQSYTITTFVGGGIAGNGGGLAVDAAGNLFVGDTGASLILKVAPNGMISVFAGDINNNGGGYYGDEGPAIGAGLNHPFGITVDSAGNVFIADSGNGRIRKVSPTGIINTVAGGGSNFPSSGPATQASLFSPVAVAVDAAGDIFIGSVVGSGASDEVFKVTPGGIISAFAGGGDFSLQNIGDGGPATSAFFTMRGLSVDSSGNLYIADGGLNRIRKISAKGIITTVAGSSSSSYSGDGGQATSAGLNAPSGVAVDSAGNLYIADAGDYRVRKVALDGTINSIAGTGRPGNSGDGGPATSAAVNSLNYIAVGNVGTVYFTDVRVEDGAGLIRLLSPQAGGFPPAITPSGVVSASSFGKFGAVAPGSLMEIYGSNLAKDTLGWGSSFVGVHAPTSLDGTSVTIGGEDAFVAYVSPSQVNVQVPSSVGTGPQRVIVKTPSGTNSPYAITVNPTEPGLLAPTSFNIDGKQYIAAFFSDGVTLALPPGAISGVPSRRAKPGDSLTLWGIGFGPVIPNIPAGQIAQGSSMLAASFQVKFGSSLAAVAYAGLAPGETGVYQFDVTVPSIPSNDAVPVTFTLGGVAGTQTLYIAVQNGTPAVDVQSLVLSGASVAAGGTVQ